ncbi:MAG: MFS transporter [Actinomycetota bacterium]|nr:MFS transporter [Actinomycetota bacterium]
MLILAAMSLGQFMVQMDLTIVNVALPSIGRDLRGSVAGLQWVIDGYSVAFASLLLVGGRLGDRSGHKRVYLAGLAIFALGSGLCALAPSLSWLVGFRVLQGVGAAIELPATLAIVSHTFAPGRERSQAIGIWTGAAGSSLVIGPILGGALIGAFGWRSVFIVNLPVVVVIAIATLATLVEVAEARPSRIDLPGQVLGAATLSLLAAGTIEGGSGGFMSTLALGLLAAGAASLVGFLAVESRQSDPMLPLGYFRLPSYSAANGLGIVMGFVAGGLLFLYALFFQVVQGHGPLSAGLRFVPFTLAFVVTGPIAGRLIDRVGHRAPMAVGCALMAAGCLALARLSTTAGSALQSWTLVLVGIGYGLTSTPMAAVALGSVPAQRAGMASSTNLTARLVGVVFGVAVLGAFLPSTRSSGRRFVYSFTSGLHDALLVAGIVAVAGAAAAARFVTAKATT